MTSRFLIIFMPSVTMYSGESQYTKGRLKDNEEEKQKVVLDRSGLACCIRVVDGVDLLRRRSGNRSPRIKRRICYDERLFS